MNVERNISEGGLLHIIEKMWVGLAIIEVGSLPLQRGAWFVIPSKSDMYTVAFVRYFSPFWTFMMSCTIYHFSPFWTFMMLCTIVLMQVHTVHIVQYTGTYCTYSTVYSYSIQAGADPGLT